ncbi:transporter substrate-binding domain-containing protein [Streptomyces sp. DT171]|uniref:transporter substrate-binding domain-containing protein n=1 Tax=Streptomyces sp. DT171 TaxID=3416524 RepID=UPI003CEF9C19
MPLRINMPHLRSRIDRGVIVTALVTSLAVGLGGCGSDDTESTSATVDGKGTVVVGALSNGAAQETELTVPEVAAIRAELPKDIADKGELVIGLGLLPTGSAPLGYVGSDQKTLTGSEPDLGRLVASVLGLKPVMANTTWENMFVGIDSGRNDVGFANITVTEQRKEKYDFACYRKDDVSFEVPEDSTWNFDGTHRSLAGRTVAVSAGTNQEKMLLRWQSQLKAEGGAPLTVKYFQDINSTYLALSSGKIDAYFGPNPSVVYHTVRTAKTRAATRNAGKVSGAGTTLQGLICATTKKDNGLAKPLADAINHLISTGQYGKWLNAWHLEGESVPVSRVNPPGLPRSNS